MASSIMVGTNKMSKAVIVALTYNNINLAIAFSNLLKNAFNITFEISTTLYAPMQPQHVHSLSRHTGSRIHHQVWCNESPLFCFCCWKRHLGSLPKRCTGCSYARSIRPTHCHHHPFRHYPSCCLDDDTYFAPPFCPLMRSKRS
jgi:hypothetical protein